MSSYHLDIIVDGEDNASGVLSGIGGAVGGLGKALLGLTAGGLAALGAGFAASISKAMDFDQTMSGLQAVSQATETQMRSLSDTAMRIGKDTSFGASDAAAAMEMLSANGLKVEDILNGAADATVNLAAATGLKGQSGLTTAANVATDAMQVFGLQAADMAKAINGISGVTVASKFDINDYSLAMAQGGGVAAAVGVSFADFNTTIAGISSLFSSGSDAGTSFKTMLQRLVPQSKDATAWMKQLGLITADGKNQFFDANGQMKDMAQISGLLQHALSGLSEQKKNEALSTIFGTDAMRAAVGVAKLGEQGFNDLAVSIGKVDAAEQARIRLDNLAGDLEALTGSLETAGIQLGQAFTPLLRQLTQAAAEFVNSHLIDRDWSPFVNGLTTATGTVQGFLETLRSGAASLQTAFAEGGVLGILHQLGVWLQPGLTSALAGIQTWIGSTTGSIQASLPGWLAALTRYSAAAWQWIADAAPVAIARLQSFALDLGAKIVAAAPGLLASFGQWATATLSWLGPQIPVLLAQGMDLRNQIVGLILSNAPGLITALATWSLAFLGWLTKAYPGLLATFTDGTIALIKLIGAYVPDIIRALGVWALALAQWVVDALPGLLRNLGSSIGRLLDAIGAALPGIVNAIGAWAAAFINWAIDALPGLLRELGGLYVGMYGWIADRLPGIITQLGTWTLAFFEWVLPAAGKLLLNLGGLVADLLTWIIQNEPAIRAKLAEWGTSFGAWVQDKAIPYLREKLPEAWNALKAWITTTATNIAADGSVGRSLVDGIKSGMDGAWNGFTGWLSGKWNEIVQSVKNALGIHSPSTVFADIGRFLIDGLWEGVRNKAVELGNNIYGFFDQNVIGKMRALLNVFPSIGTSLVDSLWGGARNKATELGNNIYGFFDQNVIGKMRGLLNVFPGIGSDVIGGLWQGIQNRWGQFVNDLTNQMRGLPEAIRNLFGIHSPSKLFADEIGQWLLPGIVVGAEQSLPQAGRDLSAVAGQLPQMALPVGASLPAGAALATTSGGGGGNATNVYVTVQVQGTVIAERDLARRLRDVLKEDARMNGRAVFA